MSFGSAPNTISTNLRRRGYGPEFEATNDSFVVKNPSALNTSSEVQDTANNNFPIFSQGDMMSSSSRDRTTEFMTFVRSCQGRQMNGQLITGAGHAHVASSRNAQLHAQSAEFMKIAKSIGQDIANTYTKLEKLTLLAKRKTLFDDRPREIQELTFIIKEDMNMLNRQIGQLQQIAKAQISRGMQGKHQRTHSTSVVVALQSKLASMTNTFKEVLEVRTENLKESKSRQDMFSQGQLTRTLPQSAVKGFHKGSVLAQMDDEESNLDSVSIAMGEQQSLLQQDDTSHQYLQSRADTMQNIEKTIVELGGIFSQLAHMIKEQEEIMIRIDSNVEDTAMNVEAGHGEILKYFQSVTSNRWLMIKVFGVLIFFFVLFVIFMA